MSRLHLKFAGISARTLTLYRREVSLFFDYLESNEIRRPRSYSRMDQCVADYINHLYQEGEALTKAGWLLSGLKRLYPRIRRELAVSQQWYNNWCRQHIPSRAVPFTWTIIQAFVGLAIEQQWFQVATILLVGFTFFLRTQEMLHLEPADFAIDAREGSIVIRLASTKTSHGAQQSIALHDYNLARLLHFLLQRVGHPGRLWKFSLTHFRTTLNAFCRFFDLHQIGFVPYSLRRGGATDLYTRSRNLEFVMITGRWKDSATARLYLDDARATLVRLHIPAQAMTLIRHYKRSLLLCLDRAAR